jgi:colicin import membrane protein
MATAIKMTDETGTDIVVAVAQNPGLVLLDTEKFDAWYDKLKAKAPEAGDMAVRKDREVLRSYAAEVRSEKAAIDKARLRLTKEWRDMVSQANDAGKVIEQRLEGLAADVRKPLTEWEEAEKQRVEAAKDFVAWIHGQAIVTLDDTAATVRQRGADVWEKVLDEQVLGDLYGEAVAGKEATVVTLKAALDRLTREEADRAELERLRAENEAREAKEREAAEVRERAEQEAEQARLAERRRLDAEKAEAERITNAERQAAERATREAEERHAAELAAERKRAEEAERAAQAERDQIATAEAERVAAVQREAAETARREANQAHRAKIMKAAKEAIMTCGVEEEAAKKIVLLIRAGEVPNVSLAF